jgi:hypothetical protein
MQIARQVPAAFVSLYLPAGHRRWHWYSYSCRTCGQHQLGRARQLEDVAGERRRVRPPGQDRDRTGLRAGGMTGAIEDQALTYAAAGCPVFPTRPNRDLEDQDVYGVSGQQPPPIFPPERASPQVNQWLISQPVSCGNGTHSGTRLPHVISDSAPACRHIRYRSA